MTRPKRTRTPSSNGEQVELDAASGGVVIRDLRVMDQQLYRLLTSMSKRQRVKFVVEMLRTGALAADEQGIVTKIGEVEGPEGPAVILQVYKKKNAPPLMYS